MKNFNYLFLFLFLFSFLNTKIFAQNNDEHDIDALFDMSLEELMELDIVSASKKKESLFEAPVSSTVITNEEIERSGATSIPEALRLAPGLIVREQTNGNYDIHIRGFDNVPGKSRFVTSANSITLVMINNRAVYNYFAGGTFWETIPVDLNDVEKIEIVRGPSSPLYGPNAVSGVINIITKDYSKKTGLIAEAKASTGNFNTQIVNANLGYNLGNGFNFVLTGNFQKRDRQRPEYYEFLRDTFIRDITLLRNSDNNDAITNPKERYPNQDNAMDKHGVNFFTQFHKDDLKIDFNAGFQNSEVQKIYVDFPYTPITNNISETQNVDLRIKHRGLSMQASHLRGTQETSGEEFWKYDFNTTDAVVEYSFDFFDKITIRPGLNYRKATYDGKFIGGEKSITTTAASLYASFRPIENLRFLAVGRADKYDINNTKNISYEFVTSYNLNDKFLIRGVYSKANQAPFMLSNFRNTVDTIFLSSVRITKGNENLDLLEMQQIEIGFRCKPVENLFFDLDLFRLNTENYAFPVDRGTTGEFPSYTNIIQYGNIKTKAIQYGISLSVNSMPTEKLQLKGFITLQETQIKDQADEGVLTVEGLPYSTEYIDVFNKSTPTVYGGLYLNYTPFKKLNINISSYFYDKQTLSIFLESAKTLREGINNTVSEKFVLNANVVYSLNKHLNLFVSGKNLIGNTDKEFAYADKVGRTFLGGFKFKF